MHKETFEGRAPALWGAACLAAAAAATAGVLLTPSYALAGTVMAHSVDESGNTIDTFTSVDDAVNAGYKGVTIVMDRDWSVGDTAGFFSKGGFTVGDNKSLTIDMNGHIIKNVDTFATITVGYRATLTLKSSKKATLSYEGFSGSDGSAKVFASTTGGLITNDSPGYAGIFAKYSSKVILDGVTVAGCSGSMDDFHGGVTLNDNSSLVMKNGASVEHNETGQTGAGIFVAGDNVSIEMNNASVSDNYCAGQGGGIASNGYGTTITMNNGSKIANNSAEAGGGIKFGRTFNLKSDDGKAYIQGNSATASNRIDNKEVQSGGGIHVTQWRFGDNGGTIKGITIRDNYSAYDGGGIELDQEDVIIEDCLITGNTAKYEGGGIYVCNDDNKIKGSTITGNACNLAGKNYEGGGVYVWCDYDVELSGICLIYGNTRGKSSGNADDLFLRENVGATAKAYITGLLSRGSRVGIRTGITGDRRIAKNFTSVTKDCLFIDLGGYYVSYGTDENGDAWQRHRGLEYLLQVNGQGSNRYAYNSNAVANGASTDPAKAFWYWSAPSTTGLYPAEEYITNSNLYNPLLSLTMPQCDVNLCAEYADRVKKPVISVDTPVAGKELPTTATFKRGDSGMGGSQLSDLPVGWYEVKADGSKAPAAGTAQAGTEYVACVSVPQDKELGLYFSYGITAADVTVGGEAAAEASVDSRTGVLNVTSAAFKTEGEAAGVETGTVTIQMQNGGLTAGTANEDGTPSVGAGASGEDVTTPIDEVEVSYAEDSESVTVAAPSCEGYNFCYWSDAPEGVEVDSVVGTATFNVADISSALKLGAVYTPVVTEVDLGMDAPVAGEELANAVTSINVTATDGSKFDLLGNFTDEGSLPVSWTPNANGVTGKAACSTAYAATAALDENGEDYLDVEKVISSNVVVKANGVELPGATAGFAVVDGKLALCAAFPATADEATADATAVEAVTGKTVTVKAAKSGKTKKAKSAKVEAPASASGAKASFKVLSASKQLKVNAKTGKVTLKKGAKAGKTYTAKLKVSYGKASKAVKVKFVVK